MSRSGYADDMDEDRLALWRGAVASAIRGKRGQRLLQDMAEAMDKMPEKVLIAHELEADGDHCALGVVGRERGIDLKSIDPEDYWYVAKQFDIAEALSREIVFINDEVGNYDETPQRRWIRVRRWVDENLIKAEQKCKLSSPPAGNWIFSLTGQPPSRSRPNATTTGSE